jgi:GDPmannose 4,6-dehydratase
MKKAFITGITGQDGYYLSKLLLEKEYEVHGIIRRSSLINTSRIDSLISKYRPQEKLFLYHSDLLDPSSISILLNQIQPDEVYNLAAQSHVAVSFKNPLYTSQVGTVGTVALLEAIKNLDKDIKYYQASSSEMYGGKEINKLNEFSELEPKSPYAVSKVFGYHLTKVYRESYNIFASNGVLFNHESPMRGETFVTRKITKAVGRISHGIQKKLTLGNLDASRDWGFAGDYVIGMWLMLQHTNPDDWVLATGETHTVKEFLNEAFSIVGLDWQEFVTTSEKYYRPNEVDYLLGDASKANSILNWKPEVSFKELVKLMVEHDLEEAAKEKVLLENNLIQPSWENFK